MVSIVRKPQVIERLGLSTSTLYEKIANGEFPPVFHLGARAIAWCEEEVDAVVCALVERQSNSEIKTRVKCLVEKPKSVFN
jgi:prophage regulatory protein